MSVRRKEIKYKKRDFNRKSYGDDLKRPKNEPYKRYKPTSKFWSDNKDSDEEVEKEEKNPVEKTLD